MPKPFPHLLVLGVVLFATTISPLAYSRTQKPLTVCDVLAELDHYRGRTVIVRGYFEWSRHGWIVDENIEWKPCAAVESKGFHWPPALYMQIFPSNSKRIKAVLSGPQDTVHKEALKGNNDLQIIATFEGELKYEDNVTISRHGEDDYRGNAYGQGGHYRAALVIKRVNDVVVVNSETGKRAK